VVWTEQDEKTVRILSARLATKRDRALYQAYKDRRDDISVHTLRNWEQGRRRPEGAAIALLCIAARRVWIGHGAAVASGRRAEGVEGVSRMEGFPTSRGCKTQPTRGIPMKTVNRNELFAKPEVKEVLEELRKVHWCFSRRAQAPSRPPEGRPRSGSERSAEPRRRRARRYPAALDGLSRHAPTKAGGEPKKAITDAKKPKKEEDPLDAPTRSSVRPLRDPGGMLLH
jgi:hypothetical protein